MPDAVVKIYFKNRAEPHSVVIALTKPLDEHEIKENVRFFSGFDVSDTGRMKNIYFRVGDHAISIPDTTEILFATFNQEQEQD